MHPATEQQATPFELIATFQRCPNFPKDELGTIALAQGLAKAARETGVEMQAIVERCCEISKFCPTDADLLVVARDISRLQAVSEGSYDSMAGAGNHAPADQRRAWEKAYGPPKRFEWNEADKQRVAGVKAREAAVHAAIRKELQLVEGKMPNGQRPDWRLMADAAEKLGFHDYAKAWRKSFQW